MEKTTRLLRLFELLLNCRESTLEETARFFGVSGRTLCRELSPLTLARAMAGASLPAADFFLEDLDPERLAECRSEER